MSASDTSPFKYFLAGGFGGFFAVIVGHPFDTIKVKLQTMPRPPARCSQCPPMFTGALDCFVKTVRTEGLSGLYRGMSTPVLSTAPIYAVSFSMFGFGKRLQQEDNEPLTKSQVFLAGAFSGLLTAIMAAPGERVKCLLQVQHFSHGPKKYDGPVDVVRQLFGEGGIRSVYRGTVATVLRDVPANGLYFMVYEWMQSQFRRDSGAFSTTHTLLAGGLAGVICWCVALPADVLKSRLQTAPDSRYPGGVRDVLRDLLRKDGIRALAKGGTPVLVRAFPSNAACFLGFECTLRLLNRLDPRIEDT